MSRYKACYELTDYLDDDCVTRHPLVVVFHPVGYPPTEPVNWKPRPDLLADVPGGVASITRGVVVWHPVENRVIAVH